MFHFSLGNQAFILAILALEKIDIPSHDLAHIFGGQSILCEHLKFIF